MGGHRRSRRWRGFWYGAARPYFVTIVAQGRRCLFGTVQDGAVHHSAAGAMVAATLQSLERRFAGVRIPVFVVMPNHVHAIVVITNPQAPATPAYGSTLGDLVGWFKTMTTRRYARGVREAGWPRFRQRLWQRNFYDRVLRDEKEFGNAWAYIERNPRKWEIDRENPDRVPPPVGDHVPET